MLLTISRTMDHIVLLAKSVMYGNTAHAWEYLNQTLKRMIFISSATTVSGEKKMLKSRKFQVSSSVSDPQALHHNRNPIMPMPCLESRKSANQMMQQVYLQ